MNASVSASPVKESDCVVSNIILNGCNDVLVFVSKVIASVVRVVSSSVPVSWSIPPPTILTNAVADLVSDSDVVNVSVSPTSYNEPASSTRTSLTLPFAIPSTISSAWLLPRFSRSTGSWSVWRIPSFVVFVLDTIEDTVKDTSTSLEIEFPVITSSSINVPTIFASSNSVTDCIPSWNVITSLTVAVAPELAPVIIWLRTSSPVTPWKAVHLNVVSVLQSPSEVRNIWMFG